jgi:hypothetical protein
MDFTGCTAVRSLCCRHIFGNAQPWAFGSKLPAVLDVDAIRAPDRLGKRCERKAPFCCHAKIGLFDGKDTTQGKEFLHFSLRQASSPYPKKCKKNNMICFYHKKNKHRTDPVKWTCFWHE